MSKERKGLPDIGGGANSGGGIPGLGGMGDGVTEVGVGEATGWDGLEFGG